ncbi:MAG: M20/M25/M40 family metallo-hydrolase [Gemmatimonadales bacterium]
MRASETTTIARRRILLAVGLAAALPWAPLQAQPLTPREARTRGYIHRQYENAASLLERLVNIGSGSLNAAGVRAVGSVLRARLDSLGFTTTWVELPPEMRRGGHLVAVRKGPRANPDGQRILLIGHLDTVFEGEGQRFARRDTVARGAGSADMKGGDVVIVLALEALASIGALDEMEIRVVFTGDEESTGRPVAVTREPLRQAARESDVALAFEGGDARTATISRRGSSGWILTVTGRQAHSSGIFRPGTGYGAIFEASRILNGFRERLANQQYLTFNPGAIVGGTDVTFDSMAVSGTVASKTNIIAKSLVVQGDLRFLTEGQKDSARAVMREIVSENLPGTTARISFTDSYPGMPPSDGSRAVLAVFDGVSQALGYPAIEALPPDRRGAGDIAFVGDIVPSLDGLGPDGFGGHSPEEGVYLPSLKMAAERAAVLMARLARIQGSGQPTP